MNGYFFGGDIGPVAIYDAALTPGQIAALATAPPQSASAGVTTTYTYDADGNELSMTDPLGRTTEYVYNDLGEQTEVIQPNPLTGIAGEGPVTMAVYDPDGNVISATDPDGNTVEYVYNALNDQTETIEPNATTGAAGGGPVASATYDLDGEVTSTTDALGNVTTYAYDGDGNEISVTQPAPTAGAAAPVTSYTYDAAGNELSMTDPNGNTTSYAYDGLERQVAIIQPNPSGGAGAGPTTGYIYDADDELVAMIDPLGRVTTYAYNGEGEQTSVAQPAATAGGPATVTSYVYDPDGNVVAETDPNGATTRNIYNSLGEQTETIEPSATAGAVDATSFTSYDADGEVTSTTDPLGEVTTYAYDALGRMTDEVAPAPGAGQQATVTSYTYDSDGNLLEQAVGTQSFTAWTNSQNPFDVDGNGSVTPFDALVLTGALNTGHGGALPEPTAGAAPPYYDVLGDGVLSQADVTAVDAYLNDPSAYTITPAQVTAYSYNHLGEETNTTDPDGDVTSFTYDANGNHTSLTDADNNTTTFTYDNLGREIGQSRYTYENPSAPDVLVSESMTYDANGNETSLTDYDGQTTYYQYNALNEETAELWGSPTSPSATYAYTYDADGELTSASDGNSSYTYTYDSLGRQTTVDNDGTAGVPDVVLTSGYDSNGNRTSLSATIGGTADFLNTYSYDNLNRETSVSQQGQEGGNAVADKLVNLTYNAENSLDTIDRYSDLAGDDDVADSAYGYDDAGDLTSLTHTADSTTIAGYTWTWNAADEVTAFDNSAHTDEDTTYSYDAAGQLTGATDNSESFAYDATGNRTSADGSTYLPGANNTIVNDGTYTYTYDANGNTLTRTDISTGTTDFYSWDYRNRLTQVVEKNGSGVTQWTVNYTYDVNNELIGRQQLDETGAVVADQDFVYDGQQIALDFDGSGNLTDRMLWGPAVDQLFAQESVTSLTSPGAVDWALADDQNTIRDWVNDSGEADGHVTYSAFGQETSATGFAAAADVAFGYTGKFEDPTTGLQYNLNRWYDAGAGRWMSEDPTGFSAGQANLSEYVGNAPVVAIDPTGDAAVAVIATGEMIKNGEPFTQQEKVVEKLNASGEQQFATIVAKRESAEFVSVCDEHDDYQLMTQNLYVTFDIEIAQTINGVPLSKKALNIVRSHEQFHLDHYLAILDTVKAGEASVNNALAAIQLFDPSDDIKTVAAQTATTLSKVSDLYLKARESLEALRQSWHLDNLGEHTATVTPNGDLSRGTITYRQLLVQNRSSFVADAIRLGIKIQPTANAGYAVKAVNEQAKALDSAYNDGIRKLVARLSK